MNIISMTPITASQFGTNRLVQGLLKGSADTELTGAQQFGCAMVAGAASAFIASPSELVIIHQQVPAPPCCIVYKGGCLLLLKLNAQTAD